MFLRYFDFVFQPFRWVRAQVMGVRNVHGRVRVDIGRVKNYKSLAKSRAKEAKQMAGMARQKAGMAKQKAADARGRLGGGAAQLGAGQPMPAAAGAGGPMPGAMPGGMHGAMPGAMQGARPGGQGMQPGPMAPRPMGYHPPGGGPGPGGGMSGPGPTMGGPGPHMSGPGPQVAPGGMPGYAGGPAGGAGPVSGQNGIVVTGALWWKKYLCVQCGQQLDKTWDRCPYCMGAAPPVGALRTQAIMVDAAGTGNGLQLCGWLVALKGPQRGELFTLEPVTSVGTDPGCTVVLADQYMSSRHCEIRAEGGTWMLRDLKSTNGTYVNDKRVEQHELVDSDFLRLGQVALKFKSL
jgi:hypothetical protein